MSVANALSRVDPDTSGTTILGSPVETTRLTVPPWALAAPAAGIWLMTVPDATVALLVVVTEPMLSPADVIVFRASASDLLVTPGVEIFGAPQPVAAKVVATAITRAAHTTPRIRLAPTCGQLERACSIMAISSPSCDGTSV
jgi:hypothetical protein